MTASRDEDDDDWDDGVDDLGDDSDDEPTVPCPFCHREIFEDTPRCPHCERYLSDADHASRRRPVWVIVSALVCLGMAVWWAFARP